MVVLLKHRFKRRGSRERRARRGSRRKASFSARRAVSATTPLRSLRPLLPLRLLRRRNRSEVGPDQDVVEGPLIVLPVRPAAPEIPSVPVHGPRTAIAIRIAPAI